MSGKSLEQEIGDLIRRWGNAIGVGLIAGLVAFLIAKLGRAQAWAYIASAFAAVSILHKFTKDGSQQGVAAATGGVTFIGLALIV